ncbi:hypothetical protein SLEP1_g16941 [Rubroshorea leprosula]|uniref:Uncharacterized protein n=1 Tax=Rubroshorea leprosula TaxID=152421 RepID=A0AAV5J317_9ROSI|nr:hypothetical protein SLEP1_g16941 [Rubroshorea leprosula]
MFDVDENPSPPGFVVNSGRTHPGCAGFVGNPGTSWVGPGFVKNLACTWVRQEPKMNPPKPGFFTNASTMNPGHTWVCDLDWSWVCLESDVEGDVEGIIKST